MMKKRKFTAFIFAFKRIEVFSCIAACYTESAGKGYAEKYVYIFFQYINRFPQKAKSPSESPGLLDM